MLSQQHQRLRVSDLSLVTQHPQLSLGRPSVEPQIRVSISTTTGAQKSNKNASVKSSKSNKKSLQTSNTNKRRKSISKKKPAGNNFSNIIQQHSSNRFDALQATSKPQRKKSKDTDISKQNKFF
mmetsp:Transcript_31679/g.48488  ORF Transcript_31679/g.48488 Transcript_31679/m.48488 type:complete len:124 (+) Transcript_31679:1578-1949(+)